MVKVSFLPLSPAWGRGVFARELSVSLWGREGGEMMRRWTRFLLFLLVVALLWAVHRWNSRWERFLAEVPVEVLQQAAAENAARPPKYPDWF